MGTTSGHTFSSGELVTAAKLNTAVTGQMVTATGSTTARSPADRAAELVNVLDFGAVGNGTTDDTTAIQAAITRALAENKQIFYPSGTYLVTNFHKKVGAFHYGDYAKWKVGGTEIPIPLYNDLTWDDYTIYVDASGGSDTANSGLSSSTAYKTIQYAWDSLPHSIAHYVTIQLADGTYNESGIAAGDQPRPAILWGKGKNITIRSTSTGSDLTAGINVAGNSSDATAVKIKCTSAYTYGVYINSGNVAVSHLTIEGYGTAVSNALLVAHRNNTYIHTKKVILDGVDKTKTTYGAYTESAGQLELTDTRITSCSIGLRGFTAGDTAVLSYNGTYGEIVDCTTGVLSSFGSLIKILMQVAAAGTRSAINTCTTGINIIEGGLVEVRGASATDRPKIESPITASENANLTAVYTAIDTTVTLYNSTALKLDEVDFQNQITSYGSQIWLDGCKSFISPAAANTAVNPILLYSNSSIYYAGTNDINGSAGGGVSFGLDSIEFNGNTQTRGLTVKYLDNFQITTDPAASTWTACQLDNDGIAEGRVIYVDADNCDVQFIGSGTNMEFGTPFYIGTSSGSYSGAIFKMKGGKWRLMGLGQVRP